MVLLLLLLLFLLLLGIIVILSLIIIIVIVIINWLTGVQGFCWILDFTRPRGACEGACPRGAAAVSGPSGRQAGGPGLSALPRSHTTDAARGGGQALRCSKNGPLNCQILCCREGCQQPKQKRRRASSVEVAEHLGPYSSVQFRVLLTCSAHCPLMTSDSVQGETQVREKDFRIQALHRSFSWLHVLPHVVSRSDLMLCTNIGFTGWLLLRSFVPGSL